MIVGVFFILTIFAPTFTIQSLSPRCQQVTSYDLPAVIDTIDKVKNTLTLAYKSMNMLQYYIASGISSDINEAYNALQSHADAAHEAFTESGVDFDLQGRIDQITSYFENQALDTETDSYKKSVDTVDFFHEFTTSMADEFFDQTYEKIAEIMGISVETLTSYYAGLPRHVPFAERCAIWEIRSLDRRRSRIESHMYYVADTSRSIINTPMEP